MWALAQLQQTSVLPDAARLAQSRDGGLAYTAVRTLASPSRTTWGEQHYRQSTDALLACLRSEETHWTASALALSKLRWDDEVLTLDEVFIPALQRDNVHLRSRALRSLGWYLRRAPTDATWKQVMRIADTDPDEDLRRDAAELLERAKQVSTGN